MIPPSPLEKGGTGSEVPLFQGGFRGIKLGLELLQKEIF